MLVIGFVALAGLAMLSYLLLNQARLLNDHAPVKAALTAQLAVEIALLTVAPVRLGNLGRIKLEQNLTRPGGLSAPYWLLAAVLLHLWLNGGLLNRALIQT